jgi:hypothetical protein
MQHLTFSAALAEDRRAVLRRKASQVRLAVLAGRVDGTPSVGGDRPPGPPGPEHGRW